MCDYRSINVILSDIYRYFRGQFSTRVAPVTRWLQGQDAIADTHKWNTSNTVEGKLRIDILKWLVTFS